MTVPKINLSKKVQNDYYRHFAIYSGWGDTKNAINKAKKIYTPESLDRAYLLAGETDDTKVPKRGVSNYLESFVNGRFLGGWHLFSFLPSEEEGKKSVISDFDLYGDLPIALKEIFTSTNKAKFLDIGCGPGLSSLSIAAYAEAFLKTEENLGKDWQMLSVDISDEAIAKAKKGSYSENEIINNSYSRFASLIDGEIEKQMSKELGKRGLEILVETKELFVKFVNTLVPYVFNQAESQGKMPYFQVKSEIVNGENTGKIKYQKIPVLDLSRIKDESYNLASCIRSLGQYTEQGRVEMLEQITQKILPGGYLFSTVLTDRDAYTPNGLMSKFISSNYSFVPNEQTNYPMDYRVGLLKKSESSDNSQIIDLKSRSKGKQKSGKTKGFG